MWEVILQVLTSPAGSFAAVLSIFLLAFWVAVKSGTVIEKYRLIDKMESSLDKIKDDMSVVKAFIEVNQRNANPFAERQSPINLNDKGKEIASLLKLVQSFQINIPIKQLT